MTTIRLKLITRLVSLGAFIFFLVAAGLMIYFFSNLPGIGLGGIDWLVIASQAIVIAFVIVMGFVSIAQWKYHIDIDQNTMQSHVLRPLPLKSFNFSFTDVVRVQSGGIRSILEIVLHDDQRIRFAPEGLEGGTKRLLDELGQRIPPEKFEPDLVAALRKTSRVDYWLAGFSVAYILLAIYYLVITFGFDILRSRIAWHTVVNLPGFSHVEGSSVSSDKTAWLVVKDFYDKSRVYHINRGNTYKWDLPSNTSVAEYMEAKATGDNLGQPVVISRAGILHFQNNAWHLITLPVQYKPLDYDFSYRGDFANQAGVWLIAEMVDRETTELLQMDLSTDSFTTIPLPDTAKQRGITFDNIRQIPDGDVLVLMSGEAGEWIYLLHEKVWQQEYFVPNPEHVWIRDFSLDDQRRVWVLCENLDDTALVERISPFSEAVKTSIPIISNSEYETIVIDTHGRIWAANGFPHIVSVFEPVWGGTARMLVQYSDQNSGYQSNTNTSIMKTSDGNIWSIGNSVVWIDSNFQELPTPLPKWLADLKSTQAVMVFLISYFAFSIGYVAVTIIYRRKAKL